MNVLVEVRGGGGRSSSREVYLEDTGEEQEVGLVAQGEEEEELQEEGELAVARKGTFSSTIPWQTTDTGTDTVPIPLPFTKPTGPQIVLLSNPQSVDFLSTSWMRMFLAIPWTRPTSNYMYIKENYMHEYKTFQQYVHSTGMHQNRLKY